MPNWCQNVMYIKNHNPSLVTAIKEGNTLRTHCADATRRRYGIRLVRLVRRELGNQVGYQIRVS